MTGRAMWWGLILLLAGAPAPPAAARQLPEEPRYEVFLLTMDQGDEVWELFGHNALLIRDLVTGEDLAWNWGLFDFAQEGFILRFLRGTMEYSMGPAPLDPFLASYVAANRSVFANEIYLDPDEAAALDAFVRWNFEPQNRAYPYDYFRDNCSTRLRDALDGVLGGVIFEALAEVQTPWSYRWHTGRLVQRSPALDRGISFMFGRGTDRPITAWEATFLPMELMERLEEIDRPDAEGGRRPLLGPRLTLFEADRAPTPAAPAPFSPLWIAAGLLGAGALLALDRGARRGTGWAIVGARGFLLVWGVFAGTLGTLLVLGWFSHHQVVHWNVNLFHLSPLALALPFLARRMRERPSGLPILIAALSLGAALFQLTPWFAQGNAEVLALALPINLAVASLFRRSRRDDAG